MKKTYSITFLTIIALVIIIVGILNRAHLQKPYGIYIRDINEYDTIILMPNGLFHQVIYYNNECLYNNSATWEMSSNGLSIKAIFLYDTIDDLERYKGLTTSEIHLHSDNCTGFDRKYINGIFTLSWKPWPDLPEKSLCWKRIKRIEAE